MAPRSLQPPLKVVRPLARMPVIGLLEQSTQRKSQLTSGVEFHLDFLRNRLASAIVVHRLPVVPQPPWQIVTWFALGTAQNTVVARTV